MSRNLVFCLDGTWNTPDQTDRGRIVPSNVVKVSRALSGNRLSGSNPAVPQLLYYDTGVGTGRWQRFRGGMLGQGLFENVKEAYFALAEHYQPGDKLYIFGFSRGAYTARSLAGLIGLCGIPDRNKHDIKSVTEAAYQIYRITPKEQEQKEAQALEHKQTYSCIDENGNAMDKVWFVGVWDTVGALGIPVNALNWIGQRHHKFHEVTLGSHVAHAYHAIAIDERRRPFKPTLWVGDAPAPNQSVEQLWFSGVHTNIGGGYVDTGLSDRTLLWMCAKAKAAGLGFSATYLNLRLDPNYHGELRDSMSNLYRILRPFLRPIGDKWKSGMPNDKKKYPALGEAIHYSAKERFEHSTEAHYQVHAENLQAALENSVPVSTGLDEERNFHLGNVKWHGDNTGPVSMN